MEENNAQLAKHQPRIVGDDTGGSFDPDQVLKALERHRVEYLLVGGLPALAHGAQRQTAVDCGPKHDQRQPRTDCCRMVELNG